MDLIIIVLLVLVVSITGGAFLLLWENKKTSSNDKTILMLQQQISQLERALDNRLSESSRNVQAQFNQSTKIIHDVTEKLTRLDDTNRQIVNFAEQLQSLENVLTNPKQRGILGEYYLETVLKNVLPPHAYKMQYSFDDGDIVDAVIFVRDKIIPVDSKFSLENYNKIVHEKDHNRKLQLEKQFKLDLKKRIDETSKYIKPNKNTMDFAFMFIPAEGIYYDLLINQVGTIKSNTHDLIEYAFRDKHVIIVSPTSFHAYLQTVLQGLRALEIEESAKEIRQRVETLERHLRSYGAFFSKVGNSLGTTVNMYNKAGEEWRKMDKDVMRVTGRKRENDVKKISKPALE